MPACAHVAPCSASTLQAWACAPHSLAIGRWQRSGAPVVFVGREYTSKRAAAGRNIQTALATKEEGSASTGPVLKAKAAHSKVARSRLAADAGSRRTRPNRTKCLAPPGPPPAPPAPPPPAPPPEPPRPPGRRPGVGRAAGLEMCSTGETSAKLAMRPGGSWRASAVSVTSLSAETKMRPPRSPRSPRSPTPPPRHAHATSARAVAVGSAVASHESRQRSRVHSRRCTAAQVPGSGSGSGLGSGSGWCLGSGSGGLGLGFGLRLGLG